MEARTGIEPVYEVLQTAYKHTPVDSCRNIWTVSGQFAYTCRHTTNLAAMDMEGKET